MKTVVSFQIIIVLLFVLLFTGIVATPVAAQTVTFSAVGDIFFGRAGKEWGTEKPFRYVEQEFKGRDIVLGNLETPICPERRRILKAPCNLRQNKCKNAEEERYRRLYFLTFQGRPQAAQMLKDAGFTVLATANNHAEDQGGEGILETLEHLNKAGLASVGTGKSKEEAWTPYIFEKSGVKVGIIAATTIWNFDPIEKKGFYAYAKLKRLMEILPGRVAQLKKKVDFVVVTLHYGAESTTHPSARERKLIHLLADAGADVFIGTHPHVIQGVEVVKNMMVFWSLGNFLFDSPKDTWRQSGIVHLDFVKNGEQKTIANARFVPVTLSGKPKFLPYPANADRADEINQKVQTLSLRYRNPKKTFVEQNGTLHINVSPYPEVANPAH